MKSIFKSKFKLNYKSNSKSTADTKKSLTLIDRHWPEILWLVFIIFGAISVWGLFSNVPHRTHDTTYYEVWLKAFDDIIHSGQLFPQWVKSFWYDHGESTFIFYPPLFFYLAEIPRLLGASLVISVKIVVGLSTLAAFFTAYLLGKEMWGKWAGVIAGALYLTAPYHYALIYIRGAYAENLAYALFPLALLFIYRMFHDKSIDWRTILWLALSGGLIMITNLPSIIVLSVLLILWIIGLIWMTKKFPWWQLIYGAAGALGLSAFFWLPAFINAPYAQLEAFKNIWNGMEFFPLLSSFLPSLKWSDIDFHQLGIVWLLVMIGGIFAMFLWKQKTAIKQIKWLLVSLGVVFVFVTVVSHYLWNNIDILKYVQFSYRFLSDASLVLAILGALIISKLPIKWQGVLAIILIVQSAYFARPLLGRLYQEYKNDAAYTPYGDWALQQVKPSGWVFGTHKPIVIDHASSLGYLPKGVDYLSIDDEFDSEVAPLFKSIPWTEASKYQRSDGDDIWAIGQISQVKRTPTSISFTYQTDADTTMFYHHFAFPGWQVKIDGKVIEWVTDDCLISFQVPAGTHQIDIRYIGAPGSTWGRIISLISILIVIVIFWLTTRKTSTQPK